MAWMEVLAPAKVNLFLELIERRSDGFHELETIMASVSLFDRILLRRRDDDQICFVQIPAKPQNNPTVFSMPQDRTNLVWQAIELLRESSGRAFGLDVAVQKNIPGQAGMGGGSSDAAATLVAVNRMFQLGQSELQLKAVASQIGSDVAFFVGNKVARCTGRGELVEGFSATHAVNLVLAMPPAGLSTADVYRHSELSSIKKNSAPLVAGLLTGNLRQLGSGLWNRLQSSAEKLCPWIAKLQREFALVECVGHQMTGSGAGYFGVFANRGVAIRAARKLAVRLPQASFFCVSTVGNNANLIRYRAE